jgi:hypothetical protein
MVAPKTLDPVQAVSCAVTIEQDAPRAVLIPGSGQGDDTAGAATGAPNAQARRQSFEMLSRLSAVHHRLSRARCLGGG